MEDGGWGEFGGKNGVSGRDGAVEGGFVEEMGGCGDEVGMVGALGGGWVGGALVVMTLWLVLVWGAVRFGT